LLETAPAATVRRRLRRGQLRPPKSRHGRRSVRITPALAAQLRDLHAHTEWPRPDDFVFVSLRGTPLDHADMMRRVLRPAAEGGIHAFGLRAPAARGAGPAARPQRHAPPVPRRCRGGLDTPWGWQQGGKTRALTGPNQLRTRIRKTQINPALLSERNARPEGTWHRGS
jgi:hypothetical protein